MLFSFPLPLTLPLPIPIPPPAVPSPSSAQSFLRTHPAAAYTTLLTTRSATALPQLTFHSRRLARGAPAIARVPASLSPSEAQLSAAVKAALGALPAPTGVSAVEAVVVAVVSAADVAGVVQGDATSAWLHLWCSWTEHGGGPSGGPDVAVEARGRKRKDAFLKNSAWVRERAHLEEVRGEHVVETLLLGDDGDELLEGLVSNFYVVVRNGEGELEIWTAGGDDVLKGSVRDVVVEAAASTGVKLVERTPKVSESEMFEGAFITNAVRMLSPVGVLSFPLVEGCPKRTLPWGEDVRLVVGSVRSAVVKAMEKESSVM